MDDEVSPESGPAEKPELTLDLNFLPTWARKPPENPYAGRDMPGGDRGRERSGRRDDRRGGFGSRPGQSRSGARPGGGGRPGAGSRPPGGGGAFRRPEGGSAPGMGSSNRPGAGFRSRRPDDRRGPRRDGGARRPPREFHPPLNVRISFLPDRERLALVVRDIQASRRAFPLIEIANRFLGREDLYLVKLELPQPTNGGERQAFVQCLDCHRVFRSRAHAEAHVVQAHLDKFFTIEETEVEPPKGTFTCIARCRLSGVLLGPSNHHGYNEKIQELWSSRYPHMSKADYLGHIETVRDEALVEKWKESLCKKTVYRLKEVPEGQEAEEMTHTQAKEWLRGGTLNSLLRESARCMVPGAQSKQFDDGPLRQAMSLAWQKETRFPFSLSLALRPAFRHMHLNLFKVNAKETYVTAVLPKPVDMETAPLIVREIITFLKTHPGATRQQVLEGLRAGLDAEAAEAAELLLHLGNLAANGGVIEFFNGTLSLPRGGVRSDAASAKPPSKKGVRSPSPKAGKEAVASEEALAESEKPSEDADGVNIPVAEAAPEESQEEKALVPPPALAAPVAEETDSEVQESAAAEPAEVPSISAESSETLSPVPQEEIAEQSPSAEESIKAE